MIDNNNKEPVGKAYMLLRQRLIQTSIVFRMNKILMAPLLERQAYPNII